VDGSQLDFAMICGAVERESTFYEWVRGIKVGTDVMCWCFTPVLIADME
jgi:hypothetical protein